MDTAAPHPASTETPTAKDLDDLYRRAEKRWVERVTELAHSPTDGKVAAEVLTLLTRARRDSLSSG